MASIKTDLIIIIAAHPFINPFHAASTPQYTLATMWLVIGPKEVFLLDIPIPSST